MQVIKDKIITIRELIDSYYVDDYSNSVTAYRGKLVVRPKFQREFVYNDKEKMSVIQTILKGFPLSLMYWNELKDGTYEIIDGQQRTISICEYANNSFSVKINNNNVSYGNLTPEEKERFLNYPLDVYVCKGTEREKLDWFKVINIAGKELTAQELRNAVYAGNWLNKAKIYFSRKGCKATNYSQYLSGNSIRQDYLEKAIKWKAHSEGKSIEEYMSEHQNDTNAYELIEYFEDVMEWVKRIFPTYYKQMQYPDWGILYNNAIGKKFDSKELDERIQELMLDDDVTRKKGIWEYLITGEEKYLNLRRFNEVTKYTVYRKQNGRCAICNNEFEIEEMEADHIIPWSQGGKTIITNCQVLCKKCNREKSNK